VVSDGDGGVLGILVSFRGDDVTFWKEFKAYSKILGFYDLLRHVFKGTLINELLTASIGPGDYYISNIAVDPEFRSQGIGTCILENALKLAEDSGCRKVILNVTLNNERALEFYKSLVLRVLVKILLIGSLRIKAPLIWSFDLGYLVYIRDILFISVFKCPFMSGEFDFFVLIYPI